MAEVSKNREGLYYYNARWYDPELGRFTTEDPIRDGTNWYAYVGNRPLILTDPSGLYPAQMLIDGGDNQLGMTESQRIEAQGKEETGDSSVKTRLRENAVYIEKAKSEKEEMPVRGQSTLTTVSGYRELYWKEFSLINMSGKLDSSRDSIILEYDVLQVMKAFNPLHFDAWDIVPQDDQHVYAMAGGIATVSQHPTFGWTIVVEQYNGNIVRYSHLKPLEPGTFSVRQGDVLGVVGSTGASTGPHLDVRYLKRVHEDFSIGNIFEERCDIGPNIGQKDGVYFNIPMQYIPPTIIRHERKVFPRVPVVQQ